MGQRYVFLQKSQNVFGYISQFSQNILDVYCNFLKIYVQVFFPFMCLFCCRGAPSSPTFSSIIFSVLRRWDDEIIVTL